MSDNSKTDNLDRRLREIEERLLRIERELEQYNTAIRLLQEKVQKG